MFAGCMQDSESPETSAADSLEGAWELVSYAFVAPDMSYTADPSQPGLFLFAKGHYSMAYIPAIDSRPLFSANTTDAEQLLAYQEYVSNSGTYEVVGDSVFVAFPIVSKSPNFMGSGKGTYRYHIDDDALTLELQDPVVSETMILRRRQ